MMPPRFCRLAPAAVLLTLAVAPAMASSQQGPPRGWWRTEAIVKDLGLTTDQTARLNTIFESTMPELRQDREELERLEAKLSRMIQDDRLDEATLARQIDRVETARANGNKTRSMMLMRMYRVLTPQQRVRFEALSKHGPTTPGSSPTSPAFPPVTKPGPSHGGGPSAPPDAQRRPQQ
jgi:Spy/CpxP family protein refolding chaperone